MVPDDSFALGGEPPPSIGIDLHFDYDTARGFEKEVKTMGGFGDTPELILGRGRTATMNLTFTAYKETDLIDENSTASISSILYGGTPPYNRGWTTPGENSLPKGITASIITPQNITLPPGSKETVTLQLSAAPDAAIGSYDMCFSFDFKTPSHPLGVSTCRSTVLTVVEDTPRNTITTTTTRETIQTQTVTVTQTITSTTITKQATEPSIYAWAVGATVVAAIFALFLLRKRK